MSSRFRESGERSRKDILMEKLFVKKDYGKGKIFTPEQMMANGKNIAVAVRVAVVLKAVTLPKNFASLKKSCSTVKQPISMKLERIE